MSTIANATYSRDSFAAPAAPQPVRSIAIFGAGRVGTALARAFVSAGYHVTVVGPGAPIDISMIVEVVAPGATVATADEAVAHADIVVLAVPLHKIDLVDARSLEGKIVVDVMNYWEPIDGFIEEFSNSHQGTSPLAAARFPGTRWVKSFNHIGYHDIESDRREAGADDRRALAVASDDAEAAATVMSVIDHIGFDPLYAGDLSAGVALEAGGDVFGVRLGQVKLAELLARAHSARS